MNNRASFDSPAADLQPVDDSSSTALLSEEVFPRRLILPLGMAGFEEYKTWLLEEGSPYATLQAEQNPELRGAVVAAELSVPDYAPEIGAADVHFLELTSPEDARILLLVALGENGCDTVNLKVPIIYNVHSLKGRQVVPLDVDRFSETYPLFGRVTEAPPATPAVTYWTCQERNKVQQRLDGRVRACCMLRDVHWPAHEAFRLKRQMNEDMSQGNFGPCAGCEHLRKTTTRPDDVPRMIDIMTNSFCPVRCWYCSYTVPGGLLDTPPEFRQDKCGVSQRVLNTQDIPTFIRGFAREAAGSLESISLSGGDSAYHPQFREIVQTIHEVGAQAVYLSAGLLPQSTEDFCIEEIKAGRMFLSISPDAACAETWARIKRRSPQLWPQLVAFVARAAQANPSKVIVKRILQPENLAESREFIRFWHAQGLRQFSLSGLFGNRDKQLPAHVRTAAVAETRAEVQELQRLHGHYLHLEVIAL